MENKTALEDLLFKVEGLIIEKEVDVELLEEDLGKVKIQIMKTTDKKTEDLLKGDVVKIESYISQSRAMIKALIDKQSKLIERKIKEDKASGKTK